MSREMVVEGGCPDATSKAHDAVAGKAQQDKDDKTGNSNRHFPKKNNAYFTLVFFLFQTSLLEAAPSRCF